MLDMAPVPQVSAPGQEIYASRSLWDRKLAYGARHNDLTVHAYDSDQFVDPKADPPERLRIVECREVGHTGPVVGVAIPRV